MYMFMKWHACYNVNSVAYDMIIFHSDNKLLLA